MSSLFSKHVFVGLNMCGVYTHVNGAHVMQEDGGSPILSLSVLFLGVSLNPVLRLVAHKSQLEVAGTYNHSWLFMCLLGSKLWFLCLGSKYS